MRFNSILSKIVAGLALLAVVSIVSSLIGLKTSAQLAQNGLKVGRDLAPLSDAAMEIKLTATHAHLLFEEIMAGDQEESIDEVWSLLDETRFYARAVMEGGENDEAVFYPSQSPEVLEKMRAVLKELDHFVQMAQTRYATLSQDQGVGTGADEQFDGLYDSLTDQIAAYSKQFANDGAAQRAAGNARYLLAHGHVLVAEILGGDTGEDFGEATGSFASAAEDVRQLPAGEQRASILKGIDELIALANQRHDTMLSTDVAGSEADQQFDAAFQSFINDADIAEELIHDEMAAGLAAVEKARTVAVRTPIVSGVLLALLIGVCCIFASKYMATRLRELASAMQSLTGGNLETPIPEWKSNDEIGELLDNVRAYRDALLDRHRVELENRAAQEESDRRAADASAMAAELRNVVASSINGDFSQTLPTAYQTEDLNDLSQQVNTMLENISAVLQETNRSVSNLAEADLTVRFEGDYQGSFAELKDNFNQSLEGLSGLLSAIQDNTDIVDQSSVSILDAAGSLSERAADQAAQLEETSSTTENLMKSIRSTADIAADVREKSADAEGRAVRGRKIVDETVQAITLISDNSQRVSDIVGIIDGIAFQTNLLALNAAVEAARAGEAGRGFAVVASEVRALAQRASDAASDIRVLIDEASTNVSSGVELVKRTGGSLSDIEAAVVEMSRAVDEISEVTRAQANDAEIISSAIKKIDKKTQTDAQVAEESASLARRMAESVTNLKSLLGSFRIDKGPAVQTEADKLAS